MRDAAEADDANALVRSAHTLKSTSASLGAQRLVEICRALEAEAREGALERAGARIQEAEAEYGRVVAGLARRPWDSL